MPRTIALSVFTFEELSDEAKERAREWWRNLEAQDPAWGSDHQKSYYATVQALRNYSPSEVMRMSKEIAFTGYIDDGIFADNYPKFDPELKKYPSNFVVEQWFAEAWEKEMEFRMKDENVDESIVANGYEFYEDGSRYRG